MPEKQDDLGAVRDLQLFHDVGEMHLYRVVGQFHFGRDDFVALALQKPSDDLALSRRKSGPVINRLMPYLRGNVRISFLAPCLVPRRAAPERSVDEKQQCIVGGRQVDPLGNAEIGDAIRHQKDDQRFGEGSSQKCRGIPGIGIARIDDQQVSGLMRQGRRRFNRCGMKDLHLPVAACDFASYALAHDLQRTHQNQAPAGSAMPMIVELSGERARTLIVAIVHDFVCTA